MNRPSGQPGERGHRDLLARLWVLAVALVVGLILAGLAGLLPGMPGPPPEKLDLRARLGERQSRQVNAVQTPRAEADEAPAALTAEVLCAAPTAGVPFALDLGSRGPALLLPCDEGAALWSTAVRPPTRLARLRWGQGELSLTAAETADVDGDGQLDLLLALRADAPEQRHRQGLYWLRGRLEGGYERPISLLRAEVVALLSAPPSGPAAAGAAIWLLAAQPGPEAKAELWRLSAGSSPQRTGSWPLPGPAAELLIAPASAGGGLLVLSGDRVWRKSLGDDEPPVQGLELPGADGLLPFGGGLHVTTQEGLRELREGANGSLEAGPVTGPKGVQAAVCLPSGWCFAVAGGGLWSWRPGQQPKSLGPAGGARVEGLVSQAQGAWLWVSGLSGAQSAGVVRLADPWPDPNAVQLLPRTPAAGDFPALLNVP